MTGSGSGSEWKNFSNRRQSECSPVVRGDCSLPLVRRVGSVIVPSSLSPVPRQSQGIENGRADPRVCTQCESILWGSGRRPCIAVCECPVLTPMRSIVLEEVRVRVLSALTRFEIRWTGLCGLSSRSRQSRPGMLDESLAPQPSRRPSLPRWPHARDENRARKIPRALGTGAHRADRRPAASG